MPTRMSSAKATARFLVANPASMVDENIRISVQNLDPFQQVTLVARVKEPNADYIAHAHVIADTHGTVDLSQHASLGGTYQGTDGMGLLWSMVPSADSRKGSRISKRIADTPHAMQLAVMDGYRDVTSWSDVTSPLCSSDIQRWYQASDTERYKITAGNLRGTLFVPKNSAKTVGIIDLFGSGGGLLEFRAALLASHGYAVLALAYFNYEDLPKSIEFDLDYFDEAVQFMMSHPRVDSAQGLAVIGTSKGAEMAMHMTAYNPEIKACVAINGGTYHCFGLHKYKGAPITAHMYNDWSKVIASDEGVSFIDCHRDVNNKADLIPVELAKHANFLIIHGDDDTNICASNAIRTVKRIRDSGNTKCILKLYPGAGHLLEPPYMPLCRLGYHNLVDLCLVYGGEPRLHAQAQKDMWRSVLEFFEDLFKIDYKRVGSLPSSNL